MKNVIYGIVAVLVLGVATVAWYVGKPIKVSEERAKAVFETFIAVEACKGLGMIDNAAESDLEGLMKRLQFYSSEYKQVTNFDLDKVGESVNRAIIRLRQSNGMDSPEGMLQFALLCNTEAEKAANYKKNYGG